MTASLALCALVSSSMFVPGGTDLLETGLVYQISEIPFLAQCRVLCDGEPVLLGSPSPVPPWGSFDGVEVSNPLESGIWAGPWWTADFRSPPVPDSSFGSTVGLLENTRGRNRYSGTLLRPFPGGFRLGATLAREDTLSQQALRLSRGMFDVSARLWQESVDGGSTWLRIHGGGFAARAGLSLPEEGSTLVEGLASTEFSWRDLTAGLAAGAAGLDSLSALEAHGLIGYGAGGGRVVARLDASRTGDGDLEGGWAAGGSLAAGRLVLSAGASALPGSKPCFLLTASAGSSGLEVLCAGGHFSAGAHAYGPLGAGASAGIRADSVRLAGELLPEIRFGGAGRLRGGPRAVYVSRGQSGESLRLDLLAMLSISRFSFVFSAEELTESSLRRYSYGIVWSFDDVREAPSAGGRNR